jgi:hypothetical protein
VIGSTPGDRAKLPWLWAGERQFWQCGCLPICTPDARGLPWARRAKTHGSVYCDFELPAAGADSDLFGKGSRLATPTAACLRIGTPVRISQVIREGPKLGAL